MDPFLLRLLFFLNFLQVINTIINVIHKLQIIQGPNAHMAMAILCIIILLGYSGILNTIFLKRKFQFGRKLYLAIAISSQIVVLVLSFLAYYNVMTYFLAIAIIHAIFGFIVMINFTCAVLCVDQQQKDIQVEQNKKQKIKQKKFLKLAGQITKRASITNFHENRSTHYQNNQIQANAAVNDQIYINQTNFRQTLISESLNVNLSIQMQVVQDKLQKIQ